MQKSLLTAAGVTRAQAAKLEQYYDLLMDWNQRINLTAITNEHEVITKHFLDSIAALESNVFYENSRVLDMGSGGGLPGIPIKICEPTLSVTLLDSLTKRVRFLDACIAELELTDTRAVHGRAEDLAHLPEYREQFDVCVSRAVANMATLSELCLPYVKVGGYFVAMKGPGASEEMIAADSAVKQLGGEVERIVRYEIPSTDLKHNLVVIKKVKNSSTRFPRKAPKPSRDPLK